MLYMCTSMQVYQLQHIRVSCRAGARPLPPPCLREAYAANMCIRRTYQAPAQHLLDDVRLFILMHVMMWTNIDGVPDACWPAL
jgi:hypothetical protein